MNLEDLRSIQSKERQTDSLQPLRASFYGEVGSYLAELREERAQVADEQGFDAPAFRRLSDEIDAAEDTVESIYERRVGKVVKAASFAAAGMPAEDEGLTDEERALFETLVEEITANRERVLDVLADEGVTGDEPASDPAGDRHEAGGATTAGERNATPGGDRDEGSSTAAEADGPSSAGRPAADVNQEGAGDADPRNPERPDEGDEPAEDGPPSSDGGTAPDGPTETTVPPADVTRATVHITRDVGEILGVDERAYDLARGDVVTLPEENAAPLLERDAARRLE